ncbi:CocE/NonD family hydrolase [Xanthomonas graminis]|jgi:putative CocE/NonD family hydrolase|uniref:Glutaryl-7-aminocephalosporanic-acid acylase n=1 Tax=Xanthomonas graminis pv. graminis TaxID=134874 RepID=A0A1M4J935_9XANT|nr:CocE/NonD family hydrolase [Xanthomonas translucens]EKU24896.1 Putative alpha-amino acid ester hydrolase [Xanthomonas translucens pv. graminis ART-Xtg29]OAX59157.1 glutaryl-7-ACA acylase [Xanthomonas translucens pv. graminis]UKE55648.1 CocE/NonD family hydrolase [Xanthomonas translucens pv. graminis]WIH10023.1 CocE/NonD family hydrolase [Xanthomonas translucens pv. graminis]WIH11242.1 CocE/NonD family hydrolase [Xanthomonas translucens pv. graminis]
MHRLACCLLATAIAAATSPAMAQTAPMTPDITGKAFVAPTAANDYVKREVMIPMRDGVKLHTVIVLPKGAQHAPMLLTRTPYDASGRASRLASPHMRDLLPQGDEVFVDSGYIRVFQDIRGKYGSQGDYVMTRPLRGSLNGSKVDHATDAWDTIDWLVKNVHESNGKVGMLGSSYEGFTVVMALTDPHPALKVAAPESPMIDGWMGDDWLNYGAFRQINFDYFTGQLSKRGKGSGIPRQGHDDYSNFLRAGSAGDYAKAAGLEQLPWWHKLTEHPAYDAFWQDQALDKVMARTRLKVPTMWLQGLWDQEDMWSAIHSYQAMEPRDAGNDRNYLVMGPWRHSQVNYDGSALGALKFDGDTALQFRRDVLKPFFDQYLVDGAAKADTPPVFIYNTGENHWDRLQAWPRSCAQGCVARSKPLYLGAGGTLSFDAPTAGQGDYEEYVSDPAKPVPFAPRPVAFGDRDMWTTWLVHDQRFVDGRPDVLTFVSAPLDAPLRIAGAPEVHLQASTSGSDSDWVVKLIDVYPDEMASDPKLGGYELAVSMAIFRGRYRESFETPKPIAPNQPLAYRFGLPTANHTFQRGHRVMVQVQSSLFPLYDRNPQTYVPNIYFAKPGDYQKATQRIWHTPQQASYISLPVR